MDSCNQRTCKCFLLHQKNYHIPRTITFRLILICELGPRVEQRSINKLTRVTILALCNMMACMQFKDIATAMKATNANWVTFSHN